MVKTQHQTLKRKEFLQRVALNGFEFWGLSGTGVPPVFFCFIRYGRDARATLKTQNLAQPSLTTPTRRHAVSTLSLPLEKLMNDFGQPVADPVDMRYFGRRCLPKPLERTEVFQQCLFAVLADPWAVVQDAFRNSLFHKELMIAVREAMCLVSNPL